MNRIHSILAITVLMATSALAAENITTDMIPAQNQVSTPGSYLISTTKTFVELTDGSYGIEVILTSRLGRHAKANSNAIFKPAKGSIHREGDKLIWSVDGEEITVANHEWYYYPAWQTTPNASLDVQIEKATTGGSETYNVSAMLKAN